MASWNLIFCCLVVKDFPVTKTTRLDGIALFVTTRTSHSLVPNCLQSRQPGSFGGGHGLCGGDHEPLWGRSLHTPGGSRKSEGDPWFCLVWVMCSFWSAHMHAYVMWPCMFMTSFCYRSGLILKGASWSWWHNTSLTWRTEPSTPGPMYVPVHNMCQSILRI